MSDKHPGGRPRILDSNEQAKELIDLMFEKLEDDDIPTVEDLCEALGMCSRSTLFDYEKMEEFSNTIKKAKQKIFNIQKKLALKNKVNPTVFIFNAKNNYGMKDKTEVENSGEQTLTIKRQIVKADNDS